MRRRQFLGGLAVAGAGVLAGCSQPNGSLRLTPTDDDAGLAERYARSIEGMPPELRDFFVAVIEDGPKTWEGSGPRFDGERPVEHDGAYYRIDREIIETRTQSQYVIEVDYDPERPVDGETIAFEDLPEIDQAALEDLLPPPEDHEANDGYDLGRGHRYPPDADSVLVPEQQYDAVSYEGTAYPIRVEYARDVEVHTYRYTATQVAEGASELATDLREESRFTLSGLSSEERKIVESAIEDEYRVDSEADPPAAFESLLERFRAHEAVEREEYRGDWLVRYEGVEYWAELGFPVTETDTDDTPSVTPPPRE